MSDFSEQHWHLSWKIIARVTKFVKKRIFIPIYLPSSQRSFTVVQHTVEFVTLSTRPSPQPSNVILPQICLSHCPWFFKPILVFLGGSAENPDSTCTHWPHSELGPTKSILKYISEIARVERNLPPAKIPKILPRYSLSWVFNSWRDKKVSSFWLNKPSLFLPVVKFTGWLHCFSGNRQYCSSV